MSKFNPERAVVLNDRLLIGLAREMFKKAFTDKGKVSQMYKRELFWKTVYKIYPELKDKHHIYITGDRGNYTMLNIQIRYKDYKENK